MADLIARKTLAVIGGTGNLGLGLAYRWAKAGHILRIGSRDSAKAQAAAQALSARVPGAAVSGHDNAQAAADAEIVTVSVPFAAQRDTLISIKNETHGKIVIDTTVALKPPKVGVVQLPPEGSAAAIAQQVLGTQARLVAAFQNVAAGLLDSDARVECDVLICGNEAAACETVRLLAADAGLTAYHAGPIENAVAVEGLTSILITLNRRYKAGHAGIHITGMTDH